MRSRDRRRRSRRDRGRRRRTGRRIRQSRISKSTKLTKQFIHTIHNTIKIGINSAIQHTISVGVHRSQIQIKSNASHIRNSTGRERIGAVAWRTSHVERSSKLTNSRINTIIDTIAIHVHTSLHETSVFRIQQVIVKEHTVLEEIRDGIVIRIQIDMIGNTVPIRVGEIERHTFQGVSPTVRVAIGDIIVAPVAVDFIQTTFEKIR